MKKQLTITFEETESSQEKIDLMTEITFSIAHILEKHGIHVRVKEEDVEEKKI